MKGEPRPVEDFAEIFAAFRDSKEPILLVGGHAVNVWALSYYDRARSRWLSRMTSRHSKESMEFASMTFFLSSP